MLTSRSVGAIVAAYIAFSCVIWSVRVETSEEKIERIANIAANIACVIIAILLISPIFLPWLNRILQQVNL